MGPTSQGIWSPKTLNLVPLFLGRIPLLEMLGSAARSIFLTKKGPPGDQIPCLQHIYIYIYPSVSLTCFFSLSLYLSFFSLCSLLSSLRSLLLFSLSLSPPYPLVVVSVCFCTLCCSFPMKLRVLSLVFIFRAHAWSCDAQLSCRVDTFARLVASKMGANPRMLQKASHGTLPHSPSFLLRDLLG